MQIPVGWLNSLTRVYGTDASWRFGLKCLQPGRVDYGAFLVGRQGCVISQCLREPVD